MSKREKIVWAVRPPGGDESESKARLILSGLILVALLAGPVLIPGGKDPEGKGPQAESAAERTVTAQAVVVDTEGEVSTSKETGDSAGSQYGRYFPGRQAM